MSTFTMREREGSETFHRIYNKRKTVGRVCQHADGGWLGIIGKTTVRRSTPRQAFDDVVAIHLGYPSGAALREKNRRVAQVRRAVNQAGDAALAEMQRGNFAPVEKMLSHPVTATALVGAFGRSLNRDVPGAYRRRR